MTHRLILGISGNVRRPSRTAALVSDVTSRLAERVGAPSRIIELVDAAPVLFRALTAAHLDEEGAALVKAVETADALVVGSPVYRASYTGALKHLFDLVGYETLAGKPVVLVATGGTPLHGLVPDHQLRPLFAFFRSLVLPTPLYALDTDFTNYRITNPAVEGRLDRVVEEAGRVIEGAWRGEEASLADAAA
ncbi:FMN reductase [Ancylobacter lacus]|uniref:FMN reductase n=1 Tax=Ancylobacter lacus TaxID=2579970 RepID=UPI001BCE59FA|nr:FMN reductase [Ancylobacter lacus]MBS7537370.1 FMN reductase [Ancylobacter lacus]